MYIYLRFLVSTDRLTKETCLITLEAALDSLSRRISNKPPPFPTTFPRMASVPSMTTKSTDVEDAAFRSIPWCATLLNDPTYQLVPNAFRELIPNSTQMALVNRTLNTSDTIAAWCTLLRRPQHSPSNASDVSLTLFSLGVGLDGTPGMMHGGMTAVLFDGVVTLLTGLCRESQGLTGYNVTKELKVVFVAACVTPGVVVVESRVVGVRKDRRYELAAEMRDGRGKVLARAEVVTVGVDRPANL